MDRRFLRPGWIAGHVLVVGAVLTCLRLGWWQWERTQESTGTAQNFGYALLWPAFGAAFIYMWVRFLHMEVLKDVEDEQDTERGLREMLDGTFGGAALGDGIRVSESESFSSAAHSAADTASVRPGLDADDGIDDALQRRRERLGGHLHRPGQGVTISVATVGGDDDDDPELTAYNQALAALAEEDGRRAR